MTRADRNHNPMAFTVSLARQSGLVAGVDYEAGDSFPLPSSLITARILGDPLAVTIKLISAVGFYTHSGTPRWNYLMLPMFLWDGMSYEQKRDLIGFAYHREGGTAMVSLFPNYGEL